MKKIFSKQSSVLRVLPTNCIMIVMFIMVAILGLSGCTKRTENSGDYVAAGKISPEISFEIGRKGFRDGNFDFSLSSEPEKLAEKINTIQDAVFYFQESGFCFDITDPIYVDETCSWVWAASGREVIEKGCAGTNDIVNAASFFLKDDFDESGMIYIVGDGYRVYNWFRLDTTYYVIDFAQVLWDISADHRDYEYVVSKFNDIEEMKSYYHETVNTDRTILAVMVPAEENGDQPALYMNCLSDSALIYDGHSVIGFEPVIYERAVLLYENMDFDYELAPINR